MSGITDDRYDPDLNKINGNGQQEKYLVLSDEEKEKGFIRPVRKSYKHLHCGGVTTMGQSLAETYARDPTFYGSTFCAICREHFFLYEDGKRAFVWDDGSGQGVGE